MLFASKSALVRSGGSEQFTAFVMSKATWELEGGSVLSAINVSQLSQDCRAM